jgi:formate hydrogenlyase subunit 3/multisubunit Na+/H+ antiporter MnhD subunit
MVRFVFLLDRLGAVLDRITTVMAIVSGALFLLCAIYIIADIHRGPYLALLPLGDEKSARTC